MLKASATRILLKNGVLLIHDADYHVVASKKDILIENGTIAKIGGAIGTSDGLEVIDCTDKIISPGFVDTHHHGWQTQLKARHANESLLEYMVTGNIQSFQFSPEDVFYGQLAGMLEDIASSTTTVIDHAHVTCSPDHAKLGIAATASPGIRSVFCYTPLMRVKEFKPLSFHPNPFEDWVMRTFDELADKGPFDEGRVELGFAFDLFFLTSEMMKGLFPQVKGKGVKTITCHGSVSLGNVVQSLKGLDLLDISIIISHGGLGVGCHTITGGSLLTEARIGLQNARSTFGEYYVTQGKLPRTIPENFSVEAAFNLATINGAEAINTNDKVGRIADGFKADLVVFDSLSPSMVPAAQHDPVAIIVDGIIRKKDGKLLPVSVDEAARQVTGEIALDWTAIAKKIISSRARVQKEMDKIDFGQASEALHKLFHVDESYIVDV